MGFPARSAVILLYSIPRGRTELICYTILNGLLHSKPSGAENSSSLNTGRGGSSESGDRDDGSSGLIDDSESGNQEGRETTRSIRNNSCTITQNDSGVSAPNRQGDSTNQSGYSLGIPTGGMLQVTGDRPSINIDVMQLGASLLETLVPGPDQARKTPTDLSPSSSSRPVAEPEASVNVIEYLDPGHQPQLAQSESSGPGHISISRQFGDPIDIGLLAVHEATHLVHLWVHRLESVSQVTIGNKLIGRL